MRRESEAPRRVLAGRHARFGLTRRAGLLLLLGPMGFFPVMPLARLQSPVASAPSGARPASDIFLVTIDTLRADHVRCYGDANIRTLALDRLAAEGVRFANAFTPSPITNASHASILTGLLPTHQGVRDFGMPLTPDVPTLAEVLRAHGYFTAAFIGSVVLDSKSLAPGFDRGFSYYDNFPTNLPKTASRYLRLERRGRDVEHRAETWMLSHKDAQPQFVWLHFYDPHDPYDPPPPYRNEYAGRLYDGEIAYADSALGQFVEFLRRQKLYESSALIVVGDHGEGLGDHGEQTHGIFLYDSTTHVPLIVKPPADPGNQEPAAQNRNAQEAQGIVVTSQVTTLDIFPTILDVEGIEYRRPLDGASLRPLWATGAGESARSSQAPSDVTPSDRAAFAETDYPLGFGWAPLRAVRTKGEKYIEAPRPEFYNLRHDPNEIENIYEPWNAEVQNLRALLAGVRDAGEVAPLRGAEANAVGDAKIEELKALGYLGKNPGSTTAPEPFLLPDPKEKIQVYNLVHNSMLAAEDSRAPDARRDLERALNLDPNSFVILDQLGELELAQRRFAKAAKLLDRALQIRPKDASAAAGEARARYLSGDLQGARARLEASEDVLAGNYEARCLLGKIDLELMDWESAKDPLQAAIILDATRPEAYIELGRLYLAQRKPAEALKQLEQAKRLAPKSREISSLMFQAHQQEGKRTTTLKPTATTKKIPE